MIHIGFGTFALLLLAAAVVGALLGFIPDWHRAMHRGPELPLWQFLRRRGKWRADLEGSIGLRACRQAEIRCAACASREACLERLASADAAVPADCPNAALMT